MNNESAITLNISDSSSDWNSVTPAQRKFLIQRCVIDTVMFMLVWLSFCALVALGYWIFDESLSQKIPHDSFNSGLYVLITLGISLSLIEIPIFCWLEIPLLKWKLTETQLCSKSGWLFQHISVMPLCRAQTYHLSQGLLEKRFGVALLTVHVSGENKFEINYLTNEQIDIVTRMLDNAIKRDTARNETLQDV